MSVTSTRYLHVFFIYRRSSLGLLGVQASSSFMDETLSLALVLSRYDIELTASFLDTVTLSRLTGLEARPPPSGYSFVRYFSSGTLARQSYSPVTLSPTRTVSFNLARVI